MVCDGGDWCEETVTDVLDVQKAAGGLMVRIELVQTNAHTCTFEGELEPSGDRAWSHRAKAGEEPCELTLTWREPELSIRSEGCRDYCGARASLFADFVREPVTRK